MSTPGLKFNVDPALIRNRLSGGGSKKNKISYFKPSKEKSQTVKLVPFTEGNDIGIAVENGYPIIEVKQHFPLKDYFQGNFKKIVSPMTFGEPDPIITMFFELRTQYADNLDDEQVKNFLQPLEGKSRYFSFVLHETSAGNELKLWSYPYGTFKQICAFLAEPDELGDILDPDNGHALNVKMNSDNTTTILLKQKVTQLTEDDIELIMNQPSLKDNFQYESEAELLRILDCYLSEETSDNSEVTSEPEPKTEIEEVEKPVIKPVVVTTKEKTEEPKPKTEDVKPKTDNANFKALFNKNK